MEHFTSKRIPDRKKLFFGVAIAFSFLVGIWFRNVIPVAVVDGQFIKRSEFTSLLLEHAGREVMQKIVIKKFVNDEAKRRKITVTKEDIATQLKIINQRLKKEKATFAQYLATQKITERQFLEELDLQIKVKKMFGPSITVTDQEIDEYLKQKGIVKGKGAIYQSQKVDIYDVLFKQKLQNEFRLFLAKRLKETKVRYFVKI